MELGKRDEKELLENHIDLENNERLRINFQNGKVKDEKYVENTKNDEVRSTFQESKETMRT